MSFIGFDAVTVAPAAATESPSSTDSFDPLYCGEDGDILLATKKLLKKDTKTKLKGLAEVESLIETTPSPVLRGLVSHWLYVLTRSFLDSDRRVRIQICQTHAKLVAKVPKAIHNRSGGFIAQSLMLKCDPDRDVATAAQVAFDITAEVNNLTFS